jgi:hypothetical protein
MPPRTRPAVLIPQAAYSYVRNTSGCLSADRGPGLATCICSGTDLLRVARALLSATTRVARDHGSSCHPVILISRLVGSVRTA